ncbi:response regulator transcription factor [Streptococcus rifensis]
MKILLVEDELDLNRNLTKRLRSENYTVDSAFDGQEALDYVAISPYDVIICDVMMPHLDGFSFLKTLRDCQNTTKVIFLTARDSLEDRIKGLDAGADDYIVKPFEFEELLARLRVQARQQFHQTSNQLIKGALMLDTVQKVASFDNQVLPLTAKEYQVLLYLMQHLDHILSRDQILSHVWDLDYEGGSNIVDVLIKNIRKKLAEVTDDTIIETKRGLGYVIHSS